MVGLTTRQIARAYLVPEWRPWPSGSAGPSGPSRVRFNQPRTSPRCCACSTWSSTSGYPGDVDLAAEAIRLTRQLAAKINHEEVAARLRSCCCTTRGARYGPAPDGRLVPSPSRTAAGGHPPDCRGRRRAPDSLARDRLGSSRPRPPSPRCTPTPGRPRRPTGCRSWSGTTNWCGSPTARWPASTGPSRSAICRRPAGRTGRPGGARPLSAPPHRRRGVPARA